MLSFRNLELFQLKKQFIKQKNLSKNQHKKKYLFQYHKLMVLFQFLKQPKRKKGDQEKIQLQIILQLFRLRMQFFLLPIQQIILQFFLLPIQQIILQLHQIIQFFQDIIRQVVILLICQTKKLIYLNINLHIHLF